MWSRVLFFIASVSSPSVCNAITNASFNSNIREYSEKDSKNLSNVKTLQKVGSGRYAEFAQAGKPIKFKEIPDSDLSSSSYSRGLLYHDQPGYGLIDYEESPRGYEYQWHDSNHHDVHGPQYGHHDHHDYSHYPVHHHLDHGHGHLKHYTHALAAKTILWPIAGIALLGAAAALVSNPVLLQLGVVSGKRKRRDTEEVYGPDLPPISFKKFTDKIKKDKFNVTDKYVNMEEHVKRRILRTDSLKKARLTTFMDRPGSYVKHVKKNFDTVAKYSEKNNDDRFIPIPLKIPTAISVEHDST